MLSASISCGSKNKKGLLQKSLGGVWFEKIFSIFIFCFHFLNIVFILIYFLFSKMKILKN